MEDQTVTQPQNTTPMTQNTAEVAQNAPATETTADTAAESVEQGPKRRRWKNVTRPASDYTTEELVNSNIFNLLKESYPDNYEEARLLSKTREVVDEHWQNFKKSRAKELLDELLSILSPEEIASALHVKLHVKPTSQPTQRKVQTSKKVYTAVKKTAK